MSDLAEHIASIENDKPAAALTSTERKRVYVGLHQSHLSKMADANVIEYNQTNGTITLRPKQPNYSPISVKTVPKQMRLSHGGTA